MHRVFIQISRYVIAEALMNWSLRVARIAGADIKVHWSFVLVIPYFLSLARPSSLSRLLFALAVLFLLFVCVTLHELGHSVVAGWLGISTRSIVLWPLGGFTLLSRQPDRPLHQVAIFGAGPLINLLLAGALFLAVRGMPSLLALVRSTWPDSLPALRDLSTMLRILLSVNVFLALFNLLPAIPLDGGRIVRALLVVFTNERRADQVMLVVSWLVALGICAYGVARGDWVLVVVAILVFFAAGSLSKRFIEQLNLGLGYLFDRGSVYLSKGDNDAAIAYYNQAIGGQPAAAHLYSNRGYAYFSKQEYDRALADYDRAIELDPTLIPAYLSRGKIYELRGDVMRMAADYGRAAELGPQVAMSYNNRGYSHFLKREYDLALADYDRAIELDPQLALTFGNRAAARFAIGDTARGMADYQRAAELQPDEADPYIWLGSGHMRLYDFDRALIAYERALQLAPNLALAHLGRVECYLEQSALWAARLDDALSHAEGAIEFDPTAPGGYNVCALIYFLKGDHDRAQSYSEQALRRSTPDCSVYLCHGLILWAHGDAEQALAAYDRAVELDDGDINAYLERSRVYFRLGQLDRATADWACALRQPPHESLIHSEFWLATYVKDYLDWAVAYYDHAASLRPENPMVYQGRADAYRVNGDYARAVADYDRAIKLAPDRADAYLGRGLAHRQQDATDQAIVDFQQVLVLSDNLTARRRAEEQLRTIGSSEQRRGVITL
jgi:tetratricopeptide (TPR) repeat protein